MGRHIGVKIDRSTRSSEILVLGVDDMQLKEWFGRRGGVRVEIIMFKYWGTGIKL